MANTITGKVVYGAGRGRLLGYPTANLEIPENLVPSVGTGQSNAADQAMKQTLPEYGIYAAWAFWNGKKYRAAVSVGPAYTFGETQTKFEVHFLNFSNCLYGEIVEVELVKKVREMRRFDFTVELVSQMERDVQEVLALLR